MLRMALLHKIKSFKNKNRIAKSILVLILLLIFYNIPKQYLGDTYPLCLYKIVSGHECFGCGTTRAVWSILHLNIKAALEYNKLIVLIFPLLAGCTISWIFSGKQLKKDVVG